MDDKEALKEFLQHFGVLGMHWGHRKSRRITTPRVHPGTGNLMSEDHAKIARIKRKKLQELSNAEIKALSERLTLEKQYRELTKKQMSPGMKFVNELVSTAAKEAATKFVKDYTAKGIDELLKKSTK